ncbi:Prostate and testis expressed protein 1 [Tupaia chinensis]|uniref:Prostate and testis expressed protein 1 n=1 Tax=Tupaia chinensis TaxID=246437 RepID=L9LBE8_TUPCH|nr:Prostate and testis expressed protein 1 [Tupaia chinensis]
MDTALLLGLLVLLCCFRGSRISADEDDYPSAQLVQCRMCHLQFPGEKCSRGRGLCVATMEEACITGKIFKKDGGLWLTFRGCLKNCANVSGIRWSIYSVTLWCCRGYDLCNEDL